MVFVENHNLWRFDCTQCLLHFKNLKKQDEKMHFHTKLFFKCRPYLPYFFPVHTRTPLIILGLMNNCWFRDTCITHSLQIRLRVPPWHWRIQDLTLGGAWTLSTGGRGGGENHSLKVLKVEVKSILKRVLVLFLLNLCLKLSASEERNEKN